MASHSFKLLPLDFGNALLDGFFQALFDRIMPRSLPHIIVREHEVVSELMKWRTKLAMIQSVLGDAEVKQWTNMAIKVWLDDLRDFVYDLEDMLDEYATKLLERKLTASSPEAINSIIKEELTNLRDNLRRMSDSGTMSDRLKELCERINLLELMERTVGGATSTAVWQRLPSTCVQAKPAIYGRNEDKRRIIEMITRDESSSANFRVISIVGMAGIGKTTLAQSVYNDSRLSEENNDSRQLEFNRKAWVCIL